MKVNRKILKIDEELCDGCGQCIPACAEGALEIRDGKARVVADRLCDGLGACLGECPNGALKIIEREAEEFDEAAVETYLASRENKATGCPSAQIQTFVPQQECDCANTPATHVSNSGLSHWPVQIRLIPADAPFLKGADLLVVADCAPVAYPNFHSDFLKDKVVMVGCPKFDDADAYVQKFTEIFSKAGIRSLTLLFMEVPCCFGLPMIIKKALANAKTGLPVEEIVISTKGKILEKKRVA